MIVHIRATSGGGKTTAMRYLLDCAKAVARPYTLVSGQKTQVNEGVWKGHRFVVIGPYDKPGTGGCDRIKLVSDVVAAVVEFAADPECIIVFEGLLLAHSWGEMGDTLHPLFGRRYHNMFIETTRKQCIENVLKRRLDRGDTNDDPTRIAKITKNIVDDYHRVYLAWERVVARGGYRYDIPYATSGPDIADHISAWCDARAL